MPNAKRTRDRQLAKQAASRKADRERQRRRRNATWGFAASIAVLALMVIGFFAFTSGADEGASPSPTPSASRSHSRSPSASPTAKPTGLPTPVSSVSPGVPANPELACGGSKPAAADEPKPQYDRAPTPKDVLDDAKVYTAVLTTTCGEITIQLDAERAPNTVASFVFLARQGYFDGTFFTRVVDSIDVIQGGDPTGTGSGGPGYSVPSELNGKITYPAGTVAMANSFNPSTGQGTKDAGSQFFIMTGPQGTNLDVNPYYTIFGEVTSGLDVAHAINSLMDGKQYDGPPTRAVYIDSVKIETSPAPSPSKSP